MVVVAPAVRPLPRQPAVKARAAARLAVFHAIQLAVIAMGIAVEAVAVRRPLAGASRTARGPAVKTPMPAFIAGSANCLIETRSVEISIRSIRFLMSQSAAGPGSSFVLRRGGNCRGEPDEERQAGRRNAESRRIEAIRSHGFLLPILSELPGSESTGHWG